MFHINSVRIGIYRNSQRRRSITKVFLEIPQNSQENACARVSLLKKRLWRRCFPVNFAKFLRAPFLQNTSGWLLLNLKTFYNFLLDPAHISHSDTLPERVLTSLKLLHFISLFLTVRYLVGWMPDLDDYNK